LIGSSAYEADVLSSNDEAGTIPRTTQYAALILDLGLPNGEGLALVRESCWPFPTTLLELKQLIRSSNPFPFSQRQILWDSHERRK
jgi:hypothetical protein